MAFSSQNSAKISIFGSWHLPNPPKTFQNLPKPSETTLAVPKFHQISQNRHFFRALTKSTYDFRVFWSKISRALTKRGQNIAKTSIFVCCPHHHLPNTFIFLKINIFSRNWRNVLVILFCFCRKLTKRCQDYAFLVEISLIIREFLHPHQEKRQSKKNWNQV